MSEPPVLLVHGLATNATRTWVETGWVDLLRDAGRSVVTVDLPGHGGRPAATGPERIEEALLDDVPDGVVDAVGFSLGARLLLRLAIRHPSRIRRLVLAGVGANLLRDDDRRDFAAAVTAAAQGEEVADPVARHLAALAQSSGCDLDAVARILGASGARLTPGELAQVDADVLVVVGDRDVAGPGEPLAELLARARVVTLRGVDHFATPKAMGFLDAGLAFLGASDL